EHNGCPIITMVKRHSRPFFGNGAIAWRTYEQILYAITIPINQEDYVSSGTTTVWKMGAIDKANVFQTQLTSIHYVISIHLPIKMKLVLCVLRDVSHSAGKHAGARAGSPSTVQLQPIQVYRRLT